MQTKVIEYIEGLTLSQGRKAGQLFKLEPWQKRFIRGAFGIPGDAALSVARANGKTTLLSAILAATIAPEGPLVETGAENVLVGTSFDVGAIAFRHVLRFLEDKIARHPKDWRINDSANRKSLENKSNRVIVRTIGHEPRRMHGLAPRLMLLDELAQWEPGQIEAGLAALETSRGKIPDSKSIWIGTRPSLPDHPFSKALEGDGMGYVQVHAARTTDNPFHRRTWARANPSLSTMPDLVQVLQREARRARLDPSALAYFRALRLNMGEADVIEKVLLGVNIWVDLEVETLDRSGPYILGIDLGTTQAQSAAAGYWPNTGALDAFAVFPEIPTLAERGLADGVGKLYSDCAARGELIQAGSRVSDPQALLREALKRWGKPAVIVSDHWRKGELIQALEKIDAPVSQLSLRGMGFKDGAEDVRAFRVAALDGALVVKRSLLLRSAMSVARVETDHAGNAKLTKIRQKARDDAVAASILAVAEGSRRDFLEPTTRMAYA